jgi:hypothetical protein
MVRVVMVTVMMGGLALGMGFLVARPVLVTVIPVAGIGARIGVGGMGRPRRHERSGPGSVRSNQRWEPEWSMSWLIF